MERLAESLGEPPVRGIKSLQDARLLPVWLYRVARNSAASHFRAGRTDREFRDTAEDSDPTLSSPNRILHRKTPSKFMCRGQAGAAIP